MAPAQMSRANTSIRKSTSLRRKIRWYYEEQDCLRDVPADVTTVGDFPCNTYEWESLLNKIEQSADRIRREENEY